MSFSRDNIIGLGIFWDKRVYYCTLSKDEWRVSLQEEEWGCRCYTCWQKMVMWQWSEKLKTGGDGVKESHVKNLLHSTILEREREWQKHFIIELFLFRVTLTCAHFVFCVVCFVFWVVVVLLTFRVFCRLVHVCCCIFLCVNVQMCSARVWLSN